MGGFACSKRRETRGQARPGKTTSNLPAPLRLKSQADVFLPPLVSIITPPPLPPHHHTSTGMVVASRRAPGGVHASQSGDRRPSLRPASSSFNPPSHHTIIFTQAKPH